MRDAKSLNIRRDLEFWNSDAESVFEPGGNQATVAVIAGLFIAAENLVLEILPDLHRIELREVGVELAVVLLDRQAIARALQEIDRGREYYVTAAGTPPSRAKSSDGHGCTVILDTRVCKLGRFHYYT